MTYFHPAGSDAASLAEPQSVQVCASSDALGALGLSLALYFDFASAERAWKAFENRARASAYQKFDFLSAWHRHVGVAEDCRVMIVIGKRSNGRTAFIWPLGLYQKGPVNVARWMGGKHSNFNSALYDAEAMPEMDADGVRAVMAAIHAEVPELDLFELTNQPERWMGWDNPLAELPKQLAPSPAFATTLLSDYGEFVLARRGSKARKRARWQMKKLRELGQIKFLIADTPEKANRIFEAFLDQRGARMAHAGISNPFGDEGVQAMLRELAERTARGASSALELYALEAGGRIVSTYGGAEANGRFSAFFNSFDMDEQASRCSPGELLLQYLLEHCIERGLKMFDLGIGRADYKASWCEHEEQLFDSFVPMSGLGRAYCMLLSASLRAKRTVKNNAWMWAGAQMLRRTLSQLRA